ncbi:hypothetical protein LSH36_171g06014 [Paralvinella palmiformis]|uniref:Uncharacterized protein n=1 Tax=Paralvinella palmiformis TaxID=53620 RepID=A0AAD9JTR5_9ANNE|nr:hypothetical protein LSH36_171g06014 [Paralvinella palmiformis]
MASANSIRRTIQICRWRARVNALWLWAYCALTLALHGYLMYRAVSRCKDYNELPWRIRDKPVAELYAYISLIVLSVMCLPFFIITAIFTTGNYSGDGIRLGRDNIHQRELAEAAAVMSTTAADPDGADPNRDDDDDDDDDEVLDTTEIRTRSGGDRLRRLWRHVGAFSHGFHVVAAFALLIPSMFLEAQEIKYGFRDPDLEASSLGLWHENVN